MNSFLGLLTVHLPRAVTPTIAGLAVGAFVGVVGFLAVLFLVGRGQRRTHAARDAANARLAIPPYGTLGQRSPAPLAQPAFATPSAYAGHTEVLDHRVLERGAMAGGGFRPSTDLSARAFAKMYASDAESSAELMVLSPDESASLAAAAPVPVAPASDPVSVSAILVVGDAGSSPVRPSGPHPLSIIPSSSSIAIARAVPSADSSASLRAASFADLDMDDGQTEIAETIFDEPPKPLRRSEPPRIRPISPSRPRFAGSPVPQPTPPPARVQAASRPHS